MAQQDMHDDPQQLELLRVARIGRAQGLKGEVTVRLYTDDPEWRFEPDSVLYSQDGETEYIVEGSRTFKDRWILKLEGVDDRNAAEALNGVELYGEVDDAEDMLEADEWYPKDLIGLEARLVEGNGLGLPAGQVVGKVVDVIDSPAQSLLKIRLTEPVVTGQNSKGEDVVEKTALVPFVEALVPDIDLEEQYLTLDPPGALFRAGAFISTMGGPGLARPPPMFCRFPKGRSTPWVISIHGVERTGRPPSASPGRRGDAPHETIQEFRHIDAQGDLRVFVGVLKP